MQFVVDVLSLNNLLTPFYLQAFSEDKDQDGFPIKNVGNDGAEGKYGEG